MNKVYVILADGFEEIEGLTVVDLLRRAEIETVMVTITGKKEVTGSHGIIVMADEYFENSILEDGNMIVLPGGMPGTRHLAAYEPLQKAIFHYQKTGRYLAAICAAPSVFGKLGLLEGKRATSYPTHEAELTGAQVIREEVVQDGMFITSRGMGTAIPFGLKLVELLLDKKSAQELKEKIIYMHEL